MGELISSIDQIVNLGAVGALILIIFGGYHERVIDHAQTRS